MASAISPDKSPLVVVTGATGFIATHVIQQLQRAGHRVRGTVRKLSSADKLRNLCPGAKYPVEFVEADLEKSETWDSAISGSTYVIHMASPFPAENPKDAEVLIKPAVNGVKAVFAASHRARIKRLVFTSSTVSVVEISVSGDKVYTEDDWADTETKDGYTKSKILAEKAAWDFLKELPEEERFELAVVNPSAVIGPLLLPTLSTSLKIVEQMLNRGMPLIPKICLNYIDVRDVAEAHIKAMMVPEAAGHRHILADKILSAKDVATILSEEFKPQGYDVPTAGCPYAFAWIAGRMDPAVRMILPSLGKSQKLDNSRMRNVLCITPRDVVQSQIDTGYSLIEHGFVKKTSKYKPPPAEGIPVVVISEPEGEDSKMAEVDLQAESTCDQDAPPAQIIKEKEVTEL